MGRTHERRDQTKRYHINTNCQYATYCGIIRIRGGSIFVEYVGSPHPRIYILNKTISKIFIEHFHENRNGMQHSLY